MSCEGCKYGCSVYEDKEKRFTSGGCSISAKFGLDWDPFPGKKNEPIDTKFGKMLLWWPPEKCEDGKMRPTGIDECGYIWNEDTEEYDGECNQCGKCCMMGGENNDEHCQYLEKIEEDKGI